MPFTHLANLAKLLGKVDDGVMFNTQIQGSQTHSMHESLVADVILHRPSTSRESTTRPKPPQIRILFLTMVLSLCISIQVVVVHTVRIVGVAAAAGHRTFAFATEP